MQPFGDWTRLGFPPDGKSINLNCTGITAQGPCPGSVFDERFGQRPPLYAPFSPNPVYSNIGWVLLGRVFDKVSGEPAHEFIQEAIWGPTGMNHTFATKPDDSLGFIPANDELWNVDIGFERAAGNYYSSINDLHAFGDAILKYKLLSPSKTRKWMKPATGTSSEGTFIGIPWEIFRSNKMTKEGCVVEIYTKGGDMFTYHSILGLIPDYDMVVTILVAGPQMNGGVVEDLFSGIIEELLPAVEQAGKEESKISHAGTYTDTATNSSLTLSLDDAPGFSVTDWTVRGVDIINTYLSIGLRPVFPTPQELVRFRLYPTNLVADGYSSWHTIATTGTVKEINNFNAKIVWPGTGCVTWGGVDRSAYQLLSQDHVVFKKTKGEDGKTATELELVGYGVTLKRQEV
ncbi:beta-lactamase 2 [Fusarium albosuccineum]|uniref:Beta-lactamase 2 n=1 Tax=Fusarium albosuccineum TaxID=1237068 RepID=A0A8H4L2L4_9HYPO|nr:beta-lactamase 2 [Fusarium albosuccineum]